MGGFIVLRKIILLFSQVSSCENSLSKFAELNQIHFSYFVSEIVVDYR